MAPQPNLRHGQAAAGTEPAGTDQAHLGPQLRTGVWAGYALTHLSFNTPSWERLQLLALLGAAPRVTL